MSEKPKDMRAYFNAYKARRRAELTAQLHSLEDQLNQAKKRKEYHTTLDLIEEIRQVNVELGEL